MKPRSNLPVAHTARFSRLLALLLLPLLPALAPEIAFAQQGWSQNPQYPYSQSPQNSPSASQYPASQQPSYAQQPYPAIDQEYDQSQGQGNGYDPGYPQPGYAQPQPPPEPLTAEQLEQLVAPIALYPDTLVAQILTAATYPAQVAGADQWLQAQGNASPDQIAYAADAQTWDPSVKALTAFPQVLAQLDRDLQWTTDLGNAYYNQPQDVLETVQVLRQRAQAAGTLQNTPQQSVTYDQGYIQVAPVNPEVVYVPVYNPWYVYGQPVQPYPGFSLWGSLESFAGSSPVRFGLGVALSAFSHTPFGWAGWALNWLTQSVLFHQSDYYSHSTTVAHWASPRGGSYYGAHGGGYGHQPNGYNGGQNYSRPVQRSYDNYAGNRPYAANRPLAGNNARPVLRDYAYNRPQAQAAMPVRPQSYARPGGYGSGFYSNSTQPYAGRPGTAYSGPQQSWRAPASTYQHNDYAQRAYSEGRTYQAERSYPTERTYSGGRTYSAPMGRGFAESPPKPEHSGGFHLFGGNHGAEKSFSGRGGESPHGSYHAPKAPKVPKGYGGGGGHHSGGGRFFGHHR
jgi:hypothetical protein